MPQTRRSLVLATLTGAMLTATAAHASSPAAWLDFDRRVTQSCLAASGFRNARPSPIIGFDDRVGKVAMLVTDRTRGANRAKLCLYDKVARKAFIDDANGWVAPPQAR